MELGQISAVYLNDLAQYQRILKQKNNYLKQLQIGQKTDTTMLEVLNQQFAQYALKVTLRRAFYKRTGRTCATDSFRITNEREKLGLKYLPSLKLSDYEKEESELLEEVIELLNDNLQREKERGVCLYGPHRDDLDSMLMTWMHKHMDHKDNKNYSIVDQIGRD